MKKKHNLFDKYGGVPTIMLIHKTFRSFNKNYKIKTNLFSNSNEA